MNWELALAGDMRFNPDTQMLEVYNGKDWVVFAPQSIDQVTNVDEYIDEISKKKALDELFGGVK
jgi:hypothetical protein